MLNRTARLFVFMVFMAAFFILAGGRAWAADNRVVTVRGGDIELLRGDTWERLATGSPVSLGDRVRTGKAAVAVVKLAGIGSFTIGPDTEMEMGKDKKEFKAGLTRGSLWLNSKLPKDGKAYISTTLATAGIRGTKFSVIVDEKGMEVCTCIGEVEVMLNGGKTLNAMTGRFVSIKAGDALPDIAEPSNLILKRVGKGADKRFDFCFTCHTVGGRGEVKRDWD
ncbi:MAG: FecR domain-containing protein [Deltaproteobacteria bacterium]|nr:FecR domain-containing protein [Deltaproteobacteria bacterium]